MPDAFIELIEASGASPYIIIMVVVFLATFFFTFKFVLEKQKDSNEEKARTIKEYHRLLKDLRIDNDRLKAKIDDLESKIHSTKDKGRE